MRPVEAVSRELDKRSTARVRSRRAIRIAPCLLRWIKPMFRTSIIRLGMVISDMGILVFSLKSDYWIFVPLRTLGCSDAHAVFVQFRIVHKLKSKDVVVYCDAHQSLRQICSIEGVPLEHPPSGRSEANAIVESKIGLMLACHGSSSVQAGFPTCLWPFTAHSSVVNYQLSHKGSDGKTGYYRAFGVHPAEKEIFIGGELVFFRPSPTLVSCTLPKSSGRLTPGIFSDYYTPHGGELIGQYSVCPLVDFDGRSLHSNAPKSTFKLRLNRTEVVRRRPNCVLPIFPLKVRYNRANYPLDSEDSPAVDVASGGMMTSTLRALTL